MVKIKAFLSAFLLVFVVYGCNTGASLKRTIVLLFERSEAEQAELCQNMTSLSDVEFQFILEKIVQYNHALSAPEDIIPCVAERWDTTREALMDFISMAQLANLHMPAFYERLVSEWLLEDTLSFQGFLLDSAMVWSGNRAIIATQLADAYLQCNKRYGVEKMLTMLDVGVDGTQLFLTEALIRTIPDIPNCLHPASNYFASLSLKPCFRWVIKDFSVFFYQKHDRAALDWAWDLQEGYCKHMAFVALVKQTGHDNPWLFVDWLNDNQMALLKTSNLLMADVITSFVLGIIANPNRPEAPEDYLLGLQNRDIKRRIEDELENQLRLLDPLMSFIEVYDN